MVRLLGVESDAQKCVVSVVFQNRAPLAAPAAHSVLTTFLPLPGIQKSDSFLT